MSSIKKHQCPSCGGSLIIDRDKQRYHCTFCGSSYDYEYFREEQMHEMGEKYLERKEFGAAADAYKFVLTKNPHDFTALRGLMLAAGHFKDIKDIINYNCSHGFSYDAGLAGEAVEGASEEDKEYFKQLRNIYSDMKALADRNKDIESLCSDRRRLGEEIRALEKESAACNIIDKYGMAHYPKTTFINNWISSAIFSLMLSPVLICAFAMPEYFWLAFIYFALVLPLPIKNMVSVYPKVKRKKELDKAIEELTAESDKISVSIRVLYEDVDRLTESIRVSSFDIVRKDRKIMASFKE